MTKSGDDVRVAYPLFQEEGGGSMPTSPLQLEIGVISLDRAIVLNKLWHSRLPEYRVGCRPIQHGKICFGAMYENIIYAIAIWSHPNAIALDSGEVLELRRFAISPDSPKNTASRMLRIMRKIIKQCFPEIKKLISYQDSEVHRGTIYKADGWTAANRSKANDWTMNGKRNRPKPQNKADKIRWEKIL